MSGSTKVKDFPVITEVKTYVTQGVGSGGDYHNVERGHWLIDTPISTPMTKYPAYRSSRTTWGINILGSFLITIHTTTGHTGIATGFGGPPACYLIKHHLERFLIGSDPRDVNRISDQMFRASMYYGRKGLPVATISVVDLALWDLLGKVRGEPVYKMIGGAARDWIDFYCTGPEPVAAREMGFWGSKVPLPYGPDEGNEGFRRNVEFLKKHRESVGPDFPLMVDCYMSLDVPYTIKLAGKCLEMGLGIEWWEECLHPDDNEGFEKIKAALPGLKFTTGEHEYTKYGFRNLITSRNLSILQPDIMWVGGLTELLKISAHASAYDIPIVPHASGPYSYHFVISQPNSPFQEYLANSADGKSVLPVFGDLFLNEYVPVNGRVGKEVLDAAGPGFGLVLNPKARLVLADGWVKPGVEKGLGEVGSVEEVEQ